MNIQQYYQIIKEKLQSGDYTTTSPRDINPHLEAINYDKAKEAAKNVGLDLTKEKSSDRIDLTKYGEDIE